jgi:formylglycine-generating enzyme required for sulfatase activity
MPIKRAWGASLLTEWYFSPDGGTHSAAGWALRQWNLPEPPVDETRLGGKEGGWMVTQQTGLTMIRIPAGQFERTLDELSGMKKLVESALGLASTKKQTVTITRDFLLSDREVTVELFQRFIDDAEYEGDKPAEGKGEARFGESSDPVGYVSWYDAAMFCNWLSWKEGLRACYKLSKKPPINQQPVYEVAVVAAANGFRLPTEAEWEYACRAGTRTAFSFGENDDNLDEYAWFQRNSDGRAHPVGQKKPNAWGLYDMLGNVEEWCADWFVGGRNWGSSAPNLRLYLPGQGRPHYRRDEWGFRVARTVPLSDGGTASPQKSGEGYPLDPPRSTGHPTPKPAAPPPSKPAPPVASPSKPIGPTPPAVAPFDEKKAKEHQAAWAKYLGVPVEYENSIGMKLVLIPPGEYVPKDAHPQNAPDDESPRYYPVRITRPFFLGREEVTVAQFRKFVETAGYTPDSVRGTKGGSGFDAKTVKMTQGRQYGWQNPGFAQTDDHPVVSTSWNDAAALCDWLSRVEEEPYRLPTEAEWEFACRAGTNTPYPGGADPESLILHGNVADAQLRQRCPGLVPQTLTGDDGFAFTAPVGRYRPNPFGLFDMMGNVAEYCADWQGASPVSGTNPLGPPAGTVRVVRGAAWNAVCAISRRWIASPTGSYVTIGIRVARSLTESERAGRPNPPRLPGGPKGSEADKH